MSRNNDLETLFRLAQLTHALESINSSQSNTCDVNCYCGTKLKKTTGLEAYNTRGGIMCDGCMETVPYNTEIYHCPKGKTVRHKHGSDLCAKCARKLAYGVTLPQWEAKEDTPWLPNPLAKVPCKCGTAMDFVPCCSVYKASIKVKCDRCKCDIPATSYIFHCPRGTDPIHGLTLNIVPVFWDYCLSCAYKKCQTSAGGGQGQIQFTFVSEDNKEELDAAHKMIEEKSTQISELESEIDEMNKLVEQTKADYTKKQNSSNEQIQQLRRELHECEEMNGTLQAIAASASTEVEKKEAVIASLREAMEDIKSESETKSKTDDIPSMLEDMITTVSDYKTRLDELKSGTKKHEGLPNLMSIHSKCDYLYRKCNDLEVSVASLRNLYAQRLRESRTNWKEWNSDQVVDWITQLDRGKYKKYGQGLRQQMALRNFKGKHLPNLQIMHLEAFGIMDWEHGTSLMEHIKTLQKGRESRGKQTAEGAPETEFIGY